MSTYLKYHADHLRAAIIRYEAAETSFGNDDVGLGDLKECGKAIVDSIEFDLACTAVAKALYGAATLAAGTPFGKASKMHLDLNLEAVQDRPWPLHASILHALEERDEVEALLEAMDAEEADLAA